MSGRLTKESLVCFIEGRGQLCASKGPDNLHGTWISWVFQGHHLPCKQAHYIAITALKFSRGLIEYKVAGSEMMQINKIYRSWNLLADHASRKVSVCQRLS